MRIGFGKVELLDAVDWPATTAVPPPSGEARNYEREAKFAISDRVAGLWRPEDGGPRRIVAPLRMAILYGEDEQGPFALVGLDHMEFLYRELDAMREPIRAEYGISRERIVFMPSHCHVSVVYDPRKLRDAIAAAARQARASATDVEMNAVTVRLDGRCFTINRHIHVPGIGVRTIMFNDGCEVKGDHLDATEQVEAWLRNLGANPADYRPAEGRFVTHRDVDNLLHAVFFRDARTGRMAGSLARFAAHPVIASEKKVHGDISADYPGYLKQHLEERLGGVALFAQGLAGDLRPLNCEYSHACAREYGETLAAQIVAGLSPDAWRPLERMFFAAEPLTLTLRGELPDSPAAGEANMRRIERLYALADSPETRRKLRNEFWFYYRSGDATNYLRPEWRQQGRVATFVRGLTLNDRTILMLPGELYRETGRRIAAPLADESPIAVGIVDEYLSYVPPREGFEEGGYEPSVSLVASESEERIVETARRLLRRLGAEPG